MTARRQWPMPDDLGRRRDPAVLRAAWWAMWAYRSVRRQLAHTGLEAVVPPPPSLPRRAGRGVDAVLHRHSATCLERCLVLQQWLGSQGEAHDVVIGVARPEQEFAAHAWLDFETGVAAILGYAEIHRIPRVGLIMDRRRVARVVLATATAPTLIAQGVRAVLNGFWLGVLSEESLRAVDQRYYDQTDLYRTEEWNERGLFGWERDLVDRYFPASGRVAVVACGGGREVLALCRAGFDVDGFEPHAALTAFASRFLESHGEPGRIHSSGRDELPAGRGPYDAVLVGWGAYSLIHGRDRRVAFLDQVRRQVPPGTPVLLSFFDRASDHRELRWTLGLAKQLRRATRSDGVAPELGDTLSPTRVHVFSRQELCDEIEAAGLEVATHLTVGVAEATTSYAAAVALARR